MPTVPPAAANQATPAPGAAKVRGGGTARTAGDTLAVGVGVGVAVSTGAVEPPQARATNPSTAIRLGLTTLLHQPCSVGSCRDRPRGRCHPTVAANLNARRVQAADPNLVAIHLP